MFKLMALCVPSKLLGVIGSLFVHWCSLYTIISIISKFSFVCVCFLFVLSLLFRQVGPGFVDTFPDLYSLSGSVLFSGVFVVLSVVCCNCQL